jgi:hypothetical protein
VAFFLSVLGLASNASAQESKRRADDLFGAGKAALGRGDWSAACQDFQESMALDPSVSTLVKIARCRGHEGKTATALRTFREALALNTRFTETDPRRAQLERLIREEMKRIDAAVPRVRISVTPTDAKVTLVVDGAPLSTDAGSPVELDPGPHQIVVQAPGYREAQRQVAAAAGTELTVDVSLEPEAPLPNPVEPAPKPPGPRLTASPPLTMSDQPTLITAAPPPSGRPSGRSTRRTVAWAAVGVGVAALGVAALLGVRTLQLVSEGRGYCPDNVCPAGPPANAAQAKFNEARTIQGTGIVVTAAGAVVLGGGIALLITAPKATVADRANSTPHVALMASPFELCLKAWW